MRYGTHLPALPKQPRRRLCAVHQTNDDIVPRAVLTRRRAGPHGAAALSLALLGACATPPTWPLNGRSQAELDAALARCRTQASAERAKENARTAAAMPPAANPYRRESYQSAQLHQATVMMLTNTLMFAIYGDRELEACMKQQGFAARQPKPAAPPTPVDYVE